MSFLRYIKNKELTQYYETHRALILVSLHEPWGLVAEESMYAQTSIIISEKCGIVDSLCFNNQNCIVVDPYSKEAI
tara:strand:+ start:289 stop:516 length:228 start_codon:yes stop_codon:yes gene_type:complete